MWMCHGCQDLKICNKNSSENSRGKSETENNKTYNAGLYSFSLPSPLLLLLPFLFLFPFASVMNKCDYYVLEGRGREMRGAQLFIKKITVKILWNLNVFPCRGCFLSSNVDQWRTINPMLIEKNEWRKKNIIKIRRRTTNQQTASAEKKLIDWKRSI